MKITDHFNRVEFDCKDGSKYPKEWIEPRLSVLCQQLEKIREKIHEPIYVLSGYRTPVHNAKVRGKKNSKHLEGIAVDLVAKKTTASKLGLIILGMIQAGEILDGGVGVYKTFVHYDIRKNPARWMG